ncbi:MAG: hypothetical protein ACRD6W_19405, partial [Nitrososphaerales archaeon]
DVPEASIGVIVSGTGSSREFIQRLGRLLRKSEGKGQARLIELVSKETSETRTSSRRKRSRKHDGQEKKKKKGRREEGEEEDVQDESREGNDNNGERYDDGEEVVVE